MKRTSKRHGWKPDLPDHRDFKYSGGTWAAALPPRVDLSGKFPPVYDQGDLNSCTANAIAGAYEFELLKQQLPDFVPSRLFIYYNERVIENCVSSDSGAYLRDGMNSVNKQGVCSEHAWPYSISEFAHKPYESCYQNALKNTITSYYRLNRDINQMKSCLSEGYPFVFGFTVYESYVTGDVEQTGILPMPGPDESIIAGHAVVAVGYDDSQNRFLVRNSRGDKWGLNGYFTMPYEYLLNEDLSDDFWTIRLVANNLALSGQLGY